MAYRSGRERTAVAPAESGLVVDMVRQFADRYAFVRELVQNAVDANAATIRVHADLAADGRATFRVLDDGEGMDRDTIEGPLLTLFNSSKDTDSTKIGKYGVGFVSVFAIEPSEVIVESWRADQSWSLRLLPDHSYELARGHPRTGSGTAVTLVCALSGSQFTDHVGAVGAALSRWCRHAGLPIFYRATTLAATDRAAALVDERIDRPLGVQAAVTVTEQTDDGLIVVGPSMGAELLRQPADDRSVAAQPTGGDHTPPEGKRPSPPSPEDSATFAGFYNRGLTLYETTEPLRPTLAGVRFKVLSPKLEHTLSRDDVRRNGAFERALRRVDDLVAGSLRRQLVERLAEAAQAQVAGDSSRRYAALLAAGSYEPLQLELDEIVVPLIAPIAGEQVMGLDQVEKLGDGAVYVAAGRCALTGALTARHQPVVHAVDSVLTSLVAQRFAAGVVRVVDQAFLLVDELAPSQLSSPDRRLCELTGDALRSAGARVSRVGLASSHGVKPRCAAVAVAADAQAATLLSEHDAATWWTRWGDGPALLLLDQHDAVARARGLAEHEPAAAGILLARTLLVDERGALSKRANDRLLDTSRRTVRTSRRRPKS